MVNVIVTLSSAEILTQTFGSNAPAASTAVPVPVSSRVQPLTISPPPTAAVTFRNARLSRVVVVAMVSAFTSCGNGTVSTRSVENHRDHRDHREERAYV